MPGRAYIAAVYRAFTASVRRMVLRLYRALDPSAFGGWDEPLRLLAARVPSLVLWGDRDTYIPSRFAEQFGAREVWHFPDCGHWPMVEIPQVVAENLMRHLGGEVSAAVPRQQCA